jgi:hypothetical protein
MSDAKLLCGDIVTRIREIENTREEDYYVGHTDGIQFVIQRNRHVSINHIAAERSMQSGYFNAGFIGSEYMMYYIAHESINDLWRLKMKRFAEGFMNVSSLRWCDNKKAWLFWCADRQKYTYYDVSDYHDRNTSTTSVGASSTTVGSTN